MKFKDLYDGNRASIERALTSIWTESHANPQVGQGLNQQGGLDPQGVYSQIITQLIGNQLYAPQDADLIVQSMEPYEPTPTASVAAAKALVPDAHGNSLWTNKKFDPYLHQYKAWDALVNGWYTDQNGRHKKSMVVTTGTGSGKTECFMLPLVSDLIDKKKKQVDGIKAIFIYPLNALMEDQKLRLFNLLKDTGLTFCVYNGLLPEKEFTHHPLTSEEAAINAAIAAERRRYSNTNGSSAIVATREELRHNPADILLTNPTMMEYMLLRRADEPLFPQLNPTTGIIPAGNLSWVVLDEAHTYTGAGAAELSLLLRRVMLAFNVKPEDVQFAASSATIGNAKKTSAMLDAELKEFISGLSGQSVRQIEVIKGNRQRATRTYINPEQQYAYSVLLANDFVYLSELFDTKGRALYRTISDRLGALDRWCEKNPTTNPNPFRVKVHFFYRVPNSGLFIQLDKSNNGVFSVHGSKPTPGPGDTPFLELGRCDHCGGYLALAEFDTLTNTYKAVEQEHADIFDSLIAAPPVATTQIRLVGLTDTPNMTTSNNVITVSAPNQFRDVTLRTPTPGKWELVSNSNGQCPYCEAKLACRPDDDKGDSVLRFFRISGDFIAQRMAPSVLDQTLKDTTAPHPHEGQQFLSFVDSRQAAARATMKQNLEEERLWVWSTIYNELNRRALDSTVSQKYLTWTDIYSLLYNDRISDLYFEQFANKYNMSANAMTNLTFEKARYIEAVMVGHLAKRPRTQTSPETMGLFTAYYPDIQALTCPAVVTNIFTRRGSSISDDEWHSLLQIFVERSVRSRNAFYLKQGSLNIDIPAIQRFIFKATGSGNAEPLSLSANKSTWNSAIARILAQHFADVAGSTDDAILTAYHAELRQISDEIWNALTGCNFIEGAWNWNNNSSLWNPDTYTDPRTGAVCRRMKMNLTRLAFKLYEEPFLCDTDNQGGLHSLVLRPEELCFKGLTPYLMAGKATRPAVASQTWHSYPYFSGSGTPNPNTLDHWAKTERGLLYNNSIWGKCGYFADYLDKVHAYDPSKLFVQAEHTAQVDSEQAREIQEMFKNHDINVLACSTTMEMGVDLGDLEIVMLASVPPTPANYKQRAGRSGRNDFPRSACITLCNSDIVGMRTIRDPMAALITRVVDTPRVDLQSPQVVQRHVNAFLLRKSSVLTVNRHSATTQELIDFFTDWEWDDTGRGRAGRYQADKSRPIEISTGVPKTLDRIPAAATTILPLLGTASLNFNQYLTTTAPTDSLLMDELGVLLRGTCFDKKESLAISNTQLQHKALFSKVESQLLTFHSEFNTRGATTGYKGLLKWKYCELLGKRLIEYLSTNRFTPNAHMPTDVVEFDLNLKAFSRGGAQPGSNPSYPLHEALSQYAPGNCVVVNQRTQVVRGVELTSILRKATTFTQLYTDGKDVVKDVSTKLTGTAVAWTNFNNTNNLELITPNGFAPDVNESATRIDEQRTYSLVEAMLIGRVNWGTTIPINHLYRVRSNDNEGEILYYNMGRGHGYCVCPSCGRTQAEVAPGTVPVPNGFDKPGAPPSHLKLSENRWCGCPERNYRRHVILGSIIPTDYTEIQIRPNTSASWIQSRSGSQNLLTTLAIMFAHVLREKLGVERNAVDFVVLQNGHICIYDTNPGGAGYSNTLGVPAEMQDIITRAELFAAGLKSDTDLLDRYTLRYQNRIDIPAAKQWLADEVKLAATVPSAVSAKFPTAKVTSWSELMFASTQQTIGSLMLFASDDYANWNVNEWANVNRSILSFHYANPGITMSFCIFDKTGGAVGPHAYLQIADIDSKLNLGTGGTLGIKACTNPLPAGFYPLAVVDNKLYFTISDAECRADGAWAMQQDFDKMTVFCTVLAAPLAFTLRAITAPATARMHKFVIATATGGHCMSSAIASQVLTDTTAQSIVNDFTRHCAANPGKQLKVTVQDEYIRSAYSMVTTIQFVEHFRNIVSAADMDLTFEMEKYPDPRFPLAAPTWIGHAEDCDTNRDKLLDEIMQDYEVGQTNAGRALTYNIKSNPMHSLTHWRFVRMEYAGRTLTLYPNGGVHNGWSYDSYAANRRRLSFDRATITAADDLPVYQKDDIMYDITLE